ncbi:MAG: hypothetical protein A3F54_05680 [Candidatus Kerfeldbacteria bacterium RIFCSPHIGHO2_12_FULL_48_17]|uniref:AI-2E family transporter n=1 Tax=Candidatus Kerfeldbacteria bacterium RIFCSPHIGHO2_12_FULL_48_17 TaxID=1798542 RepID=A0A1G2B5U0_9BACT|nr:MAG: hypothetical protein A3F54_05680 [Candidatus Kerfeldbacteria bacterium RIFCSPHIGHO2_12_FULL_48_17]
MKTIMKFFLIVAILIFLYSIKKVVGILFISFVLASALDPWIDKLQKKRIPRPIGILFTYIIALGIVSLTIFLLIPPISEEVKEIARNFPAYYDQIIRGYTTLSSTSEQIGLKTAQDSIKSLSSSLDNLTSGLFSGLASIFGGFVTFFGVIVITFYMTIEEDGMKKFLRSIAPVQYQPYLIHKINEIQRKLGQWLQGQIVLGIIIGLLTYIGLLILGVKYALVLALVSAITELVPYLGPILAAIPAVFLAFAQSPLKALLVLILYIVIQQLENQVIQPKIMQKSVGLNPIAVITVMLIGAQVAGFIGLLLAVPAATILWIFLHDFIIEKKMRDNKLDEE